MIATAVMWYSIAQMHAADMKNGVQDENVIPASVWLTTMVVDIIAYYRITEVLIA